MVKIKGEVCIRKPPAPYETSGHLPMNMIKEILRLQFPAVSSRMKVISLHQQF